MTVERQSEIICHIRIDRMSSHQVQLKPSVIVGVNERANDEPWVELSQELSDYELEDGEGGSFLNDLLVMHSCGQVSGR